MWRMDKQLSADHHATSHPSRRTRPAKHRRAWRSRGTWLLLAAALVTSSCSVLAGDSACDLTSEPVVITTSTVSPRPNFSQLPDDESASGADGERSVLSATAGGPGFVAVGAEKTGEPWSFDTDAAVWTSVDGVNWSRIPHNESVFGGKDDQEMFDVIVAGPGLVAVGRDGASYMLGSIGNAAVWTSPDGLTWSRVPHDDSVFGKYTDQEMRTVTARRSGLVASGVWEKDRGIWADIERGTIVWASTDGVTWSRC